MTNFKQSINKKDVICKIWYTKVYAQKLEKSYLQKLYYIID